MFWIAVTLDPTLRAAFEDAAHAALREGRVASETLAEWMVRAAATVEELIVALLPVAAAHARPAVSEFRVGAVALADAGDRSGPGDAYLGANAEFEGLAIDTCLHAERTAVNGAWLAGVERIRALAVDAPPCGYCRQFLWELARPDAVPEIVVAHPRRNASAGYKRYALSDLLPEGFGPDALGVEERMLDARDHGLAAPAHDPLSRLALDAANRSYAPYSGCRAGAALADAAGRRFVGRYAENAAFSPSMSALESALASMVMGSEPGNELDIRDAVLVERPGRVAQDAQARTVLAAVAPGLSLRHVLLRI